MTSLHILLCIFVFFATDKVYSDNSTHCSSPKSCEYYYNSNDFLFCFCDDETPGTGLYKLCYYSSHLKENCSSTCQTNKLITVTEELCCFRDCAPEPWQSWGNCEGPCGNRTGTRTRFRSVDHNKTDQCGGALCPSLNETESCRTNCCTVNCEWTEWSVWSTCSNTCGDGIIKRNRTYLHEVSCGGISCTGEAEEYQHCSEFNNIDCLMDSWSSWTSCILGNGVCGNGTEKRTRSIIKNSNCQGIPCNETIQTRLCYGECCKQDCEITPWTNWSFCNVSCGYGYQTRNRTIIKTASCGGDSCPSNLTEIRGCSKHEKRDCTLSAWSKPSNCSNSCGFGLQTSTRYVTIDAACGGICNLALSKNQTCKSYTDKTDCVVSKWSDWTECIKNCNGGIQFRSRTVSTFPKCAGKECPNLQENRTCLQPCSQFCNAGICSCKDGFVLNSDNRTCQQIFCYEWPNTIYDVPNLKRFKDYDYVIFTCDSDVVAAGEKCTVRCEKPSWILRGEIDNYTCQITGSFNYLKIFCSPSNYAPTNILIDNTKVEEESAVGRCFGTLSTVDPNGILDSSVYTLMDNFESRLQIKENLLCLNYKPNYEAHNNTWLVKIKTTNSDNLSFEKWFNISLIDINDPPSACQFDRSNLIPENVGNPFFVGYLVYLDEDNDFEKIKPTLVNSDSNNFELFFNASQTVFKYGIRVSKNASIECQQFRGTFCSLNYELQKRHKINIKTVDSGIPVATNYFELQIELTDANDTPTSVFIKDNNIPENMNPGDIIGILQTEDEDNQTQTYQYRIISGNTEYFKINNTDKLILTTQINYEDTSVTSLEIFVESKDSGNPSMKVTSRIIFKPKDVNEPPNIYIVSNSELNGSIYYIHIDENNIIGTKIASVYVNDPDINATVDGILFDGNAQILLQNNGCQTNNLKVVSTDCQIDIIANISFDYENLKRIPFSIMLVDDGNLTKTFQFALLINNVNEAPTSIKFLTTNSNTVEINENLQGIIISALFAENQDQNNQYQFKIVEDKGGLFEIVRINIFKLKENKSLDYEGDSKSNQVLVEVTDNGTPPQSLKKNLTVKAKDVNERPNNIYLSNQMIYENAKDQSVVSTILASDPDILENFTFSILYSTNNVFQISIDKLIVSLSNQGKLNYEEKSEETINIQVFDKESLTFNKIIILTILDSNDAPSNLTITNRNIQENSPLDTIIGLLSSNDEDYNQTVSYVLFSFTNVFSLSLNGILKTNSMIDYENYTNYDLKILFYDNGVPSLTSTGIININVMNVNESPLFEGENPLIITVKENSVNEISTLIVFDPDINGTLQFSCVCKNSADSKCPIDLQISSDNSSILSNGTLYSIKMNVISLLNFENQSIHVMEIQAENKGGLKANLNVTLILENVNEPISILRLNGLLLKNVTIEENQRIIGRLSFFDPDFNQSYTYKIFQNNLSNNDFLEVKNEILQTAPNFVFDFEVQSVYNVILEITDNSISPLASNFSFYIFVKDINERPSNITLSTYQIIENLPNGTVIANITAYDPDNVMYVRQSLIYTILSETTDALKIENSQLKIRNSQNINYEKFNQMTVVIQVTDDGSPQMSSMEIIQLYILDNNDKPMDMHLSDCFIDNNITKNTVIKHITYFDEDLNQTHFFQLINVEPKYYKSFFSVNNEGQLIKISNSSLLSENVNFTISVTDDGVPQMSGIIRFTAYVEFKILKVISEVTLRKEYQDHDKLLENILVGSSIGLWSIFMNNKSMVKNIQPNNKDTELYFGLQNFTCFNQEENSTCSFEIIVISNLDYEVKQSFELSFILVLQNGIKSNLVYSINIADVNERPTDIWSTPESLNVTENSAPNKLIGYFSMIDQDNEKTAIFEMLPKISELTLLENGKLLTGKDGFKYERNSSVSILIKVTDKGNLTFQKSFVITILKKAGFESLYPTLVEIFENVTVNEVLCTFSINERDENRSVEFVIVQNYKETFLINQNKLILNRNNTLCKEYGLRCGLNYEVDPKNISIIIMVKDVDSAAQNQEFVVSIILLNSNDPPVDVRLTKNCIDENLPVNSEIGQLIIIDEDMSDNHTCSILSTLEFYFDQNMTLLANQSFDFEMKSLYEITVLCTDKYNSSVSRKLEIFVNDIDETPYDISTNEEEHILQLSILEDQKEGTFIGILYSKDPDFNEYLDVTCHTSCVICQYKQCSNKNGTGTICQTEMKVKNASEFDFELNHELAFNITVNDKNKKNITSFLQIIVLDAKENPTDVMLNNSTERDIYVNENTEVLYLGKLAVLPEDTSDSYYFQILSDTSGFLTIKFKSELWIKNSSEIDYETGFEYSFDVQAISDNFSFTKTYFFHVQDINEYPLSLHLSKTKIKENILSNTIIGVLSVDDPDKLNKNQNYTYKLLTYNTTFYILNSDLKLSENANLNFESQSSYDLKILVIDNGILTLLSTFNIVLLVENVNERPENITLSGNKIQENSDIGSLIGILNAADYDIDSELKYSLGDTDINFLISQNKLFSARIFDFESCNSYYTTVTFSDNGFPMMNNSKEFQIQIIDVNEKPSISLQNSNGYLTSTLNVSENNKLGAKIGIITVTDPDTNDLITCTLYPDDNDFQLQEESSSSNSSVYVLLVNKVFDFESNKEYKLSIVGTDSGNLTASLDILVVIDNVNEPPMNLSIDGQNQSIINIQENVKGSQLIASFSTSDPDLNDEIEYFIDSCENCDGKFEFKNKKNLLFLKEFQFFDYESTIGKIIQMSIRATDREGLSLTLMVIINIIDMNDPPSVNGLNFTQIPSFMLNDFTLGSVDVSDEDLLMDNNQIFCTLLNPVGWLSLQHIDNICLLRTTKSKFVNESFVNLIVQCSDNGQPPLTTERNMSLLVVDIGNEPQILSFKWINESLQENLSNLTFGELQFKTEFSNKTLKVSDANIYLEISDNIKIQIQENGSLFLFTPLDYESSKKLSVTLTNMKDNYNQTISATINVIDINEPPSAINSIEKNPTVMEKTSENNYITFIVVEDPDPNQNHYCKILQTFLSKTNLTNAFVTNKSVVKINNNQLITDSDSRIMLNYSNVRAMWISIECQDDGQPKMSINGKLFIEILDINDPPSAINFLYNLNSIPENTTLNSTLATFVVVDEDENDNHICTSSNSIFTIIQNSIVLAKSLDFETSSKMETNLTCLDQGGLGITVLWNVFVENINEPPQNTEISTDKWNESSTLGEVIATISAVDPEKTECKFSLQNCKDIPCPFIILSNGSVILNQTLGNIVDFDEIYFNIEVSDDFNNTQSFPLKVTIIRETVMNISIDLISKGVIPENLPLDTEIFEIKVHVLSDVIHKIYCEVVSIGDFLYITDFKALLKKTLDHESSSVLSASVACYQNQYQPLQKAFIVVNITNVDEPISEIIVNLTESIPEGNYSKRFMGNIIIKDPEHNIHAVNCKSHDIDLDFSPNTECTLVTSNNFCEISLDTFISGDFDYENMINGVNFSIECYDAVSSVNKNILIFIKDLNDPPKDLIVNGSMAIDLDNVQDGFIQATLQVVDDDLSQSHNIVIQPPGDKYFRINENKELVLKNMEFSWTGNMSCSFTVTDNGLPPLTNVFNKVFHFIKSKGDIILNNQIINVTSKSDTVISRIECECPAFVSVEFELVSSPNDAVAIKNNELVLLKDADELPSSNFSIKIRAVSITNKLIITEANKRLEIHGYSICHSQENNCHKNASCKTESDENRFLCSCQSGFIGNGTFCEEINECLDKPCLGSGTNCINLINDYFCQCESNRTGKNCEVLPKISCSNVECVHGICSLDICHCFNGWQGKTCNESKNYCVDNPCRNNGTCVDDKNEFFCHCLENYGGIYCENNLLSCDKCNINEICIELLNNEQFCLNYDNISRIDFNKDDLTDIIDYYEIDFKKFLNKINEFKNVTIYMKIKLISINKWQFNFAAIDENMNILIELQSLEIIRNKCLETVYQTREWLICSKIFPDNKEIGFQSTQFQYLLSILIILPIVLLLFYCLKK